MEQATLWKDEDQSSSRDIILLFSAVCESQQSIKLFLKNC